MGARLSRLRHVLARQTHDLYLAVIDPAPDCEPKMEQKPRREIGPLWILRATSSSMIELVTLSLASYALTFLATMSQAGAKLWRDPVMAAVERLCKERHQVADAVEYFLECRMCSGFWISLGVVVFAGEPWQFLPVYGLSYWLATQERD